MEKELEEYKSQLALVQISLQKTPQNEELQLLENDLKELISLTENLLQESVENDKNTFQNSQNGVAGFNTSKPVHIDFTPGNLVMARWVSGDYLFYPSRITAVSGFGANKKYTVQFLDYPDIETVSLKHIKAMPEEKRQEIEGNKEILKKSTTIRSTPVREPTKAISVASMSTSPSNYASRASSPDMKSSAAVTANVSPIQNVAQHVSTLPKISPIPPSNPPPVPSVSYSQKQQKQLKPKAALEASQNSWKQFAARGVKTGRVGKRKKIGESSIFKSTEDFPGRTNPKNFGNVARSGHREKHIYNYREDEDS
ncbi:splicing factor Spf30 [Schizosaccharomyces pombe]|uniref:Splicing factor spf30 n=1 Tax=Schizosaccharomyces pombe (strain 972 / ATCC 24843) TaxID=284812 RepID=SPF30_SCHPO|nr:putative splicing factor Spf30 [Schizosaccharomyces pombe]O94519.1 RecName: Full=Splicing factor spf30; AltName: Full=Survival of motor neuron-related-splicing factor 30 homolog [Schizosaccharomyces pombe 972h-]CAA22823.1 splicing factor Spf30 (predicted) [Schizosaccharomyces pombe]|eukprot:NP_588166.1 putative splicing factor Spf30 [Schizosaccharomyces pombe]